MTFAVELVVTTGEGPERLEIGAERHDVASDDIEEAALALSHAVRYELARLRSNASKSGEKR